MEKHRDGDTIYILMKYAAAESLLDDWLHLSFTCDLTVHRSKKNKGCIVVETKSLMWANRIIGWHGYEQVTYKH